MGCVNIMIVCHGKKNFLKQGLPFLHACVYKWAREYLGKCSATQLRKKLTTRAHLWNREGEGGRKGGTPYKDSV